MVEFDSPLQSPAAPPEGRSRRYATNVLWSWLGVVVSLCIGIVLSPYIIRKLGSEGYGLWTLLFATVGYYVLLDLGLGAAVQHFTAYHRARNEPDHINEILNTSLAYFSVAALVLLGVTVFLSRFAHRIFQISAQYQGEFTLLILITGASFSLGIVFGVFNSSIEAFQRFDLSSRISLITNLSRAVGSVIVLASGGGLIALGVVAVSSQVMGYVLAFLVFGRLFKPLRFSLTLVRVSVFKKLAGYAAHTVVANLANLLLNFGPSVLIGNRLPVANVGFYGLPQRLLQYTGDAVSRVGYVTAINSTELMAEGRSESIQRLGIYSNRYCLLLFMPLTIFLLVYGYELLAVWVGSEFAAQSAPVLPILTVGTILSVASQFNSSAILFGIGKHQKFALGLLVEAVAGIAGIVLLIPRYGIVGVAWVTGILMILNRGLFTPWLLCRNFGWDYWPYLRSILLRPVLLGVAVGILARYGKSGLLPGRNLIELVVAGGLITLLYFTLAFLTSVFPEHRQLLRQWLAKSLRRPASEATGVRPKENGRF